MTTTNEPEHIELTLLKIEHLEIASDRDLSILGLARHMTVNGRGVVGRLIAKTDLPCAGTATAALRRSED